MDQIIISVDTEKAFCEIQKPFMIPFRKLEIENNFLNMIKDSFRSCNHWKTLFVHRKFK